MNMFFSRLMFFKKIKGLFSNSHGIITNESRKWEDTYRKRWQYDKISRSTHGVNCTGSCSWKIYVKSGIITWETQYTNYPRNRSGIPNHEPRGCQRGASYSWYIYSSARLKYPLIRYELIELWDKYIKHCNDPVKCWNKIQDFNFDYKKKRGLGGFVRCSWDKINKIIAAANIYTIDKYGPDRVVGFSPIPAMSMISYAAGSRYLSLIGGVCISFYDWYCDLPPSSPQTWGEQTDVPESADWYNSYYIILWGSNVPQTRTPDAHFFTEVQYKGTKTVVISSDYSEASKLCDLWISPKPGTDSALAMSMGHVILKEYFLLNDNVYFNDYVIKYTDMSLLVILEKKDCFYVPGRFLRGSDIIKSLKIKINIYYKNLSWKLVLFDKNINNFVIPNGSIGFRWDNSGLWNLKLHDSRSGRKISPNITFVNNYDKLLLVSFPYFSGSNYNHNYFHGTYHNNIIDRNIPVKLVKISNKIIYYTTVFDILVSNYGIDRGLGGYNTAFNYSDNIPYTPLWQQKITGISKDCVLSISREFANTAIKSHGKCMIIVGAGMNHWYNMDMNYRSIINLLMMCGCVGKSGGGWAHYVGQEKLRPLAGWLPLAFSLDWHKSSRLMNGTSFFYLHTSQWRYEKLILKDILSPIYIDKWRGFSIVDLNISAERMGWLPSAPQLNCNPIKLSRIAKVDDNNIVDYVVELLVKRKISFASENPDDFNNYPRNMFIWRSNLLGSSGKGHEYFLKYLLGTQHGIIGRDISNLSFNNKPRDIIWKNGISKGKLDLLVTLDFRMSTTCLYSDIVLPTASWYEKDDLNTSDMHPFIHPLSTAVDPVWECKTDWNIYKDLSLEFTDIINNYQYFNYIEDDVLLTPLLHDTEAELGQNFDVYDWKVDSIYPISNKTMPKVNIISRNYYEISDKFVSLGPLLKNGNGCKGITWDTSEEIDDIKNVNGIYNGLPKINSAIDAIEIILFLAPETNGNVALKSWKSLSECTGIDHMHLVFGRMSEKIRFRDILYQPRKIISSPTWSGIESESVSYNSGYTNVHEMIPWRTISGRQQFYQDHIWMRYFGENLCVYKPPIDTKTINLLIDYNKNVVLNFITPHQKWGIHSTYSDNLLMLTLNRGGPIVWISEYDANKININDNDWIELYNLNGAITARVVVSQRVPSGMCLMYHAQEKIINVPISEITEFRGGIHNSVTRVSLKPTHMIGGYAQLSWGFNYYGTVGSNRDEFVIVKKMTNIKW